MLFWIIIIGLNLAYWIVREAQILKSETSYTGLEQLFFFSIIFLVLTFLGIPFLDFKSGDTIVASDPSYFKLRLGALLLFGVTVPIHFTLVYLKNRKK